MSTGWEEVFELAEGQHGFFTAGQAKHLGISDQLLWASRKVDRVAEFRGLHRLKRVVPHEHDVFVAAYLWSEQEGVVSHGSALSVYGLSDYIPGERVEMTLPTSWRRRVVSTRVLPFYADLDASEVQWWDAFKITKPARTVDDFIAWGIRPDLAQQAIEEGVRRKMFWKRHLRNRFQR